MRRFFALLLLVSASAFSTPIIRKTGTKYASNYNSKSEKRMIPDPGLLLRGGTNLLPQTLSTSLLSGLGGVPSLWAIASAVIVPCTLYRQAWSFSVGYGLSVLALGLSIFHTFGSLSGAPLLLTTAVIFYGARLGGFLYFRNLTVKSKGDQIKNMDKTPRLKRIPLALSVSLFYSFLVSPALYAVRAGNVTPPLWNKISVAGSGIAWLGAILEAVTDTHKYINKMGNDNEDFVGPTGGAYSLVRHPNYLGELLFWFGLFIGGAPSFGKQIVPWVCSSFGLFGIYSIMTGATKRLDGKQAEKYAGQTKYTEWRARVKSPIFPGLQ